MDDRSSVLGRAFPLTRRAFLGATAGSLAATGLRAAVQELDDADLAFDFSDENRNLVVTIISGDRRKLELDLESSTNAGDRLRAWQDYRGSLTLAQDQNGNPERPWLLDARKFGPDAAFRLLVLGEEANPRYRLDVVGIRYGREAGRTLEISFRRTRSSGGRDRWEIVASGNVWSGSQSGAFFQLGATTTGAYLDLRRFLSEEVGLIQTVQRSRADGFLRRVSNTLLSPVANSTTLRLHPNGDWTLGEEGVPGRPAVRALHVGILLGPVRLGWCLETASAAALTERPWAEPLCEALGPADGDAVVAFGEVIGNIDIAFGNSRRLSLASIASEAGSSPRVVLRTADQDGTTPSARLPRVAEARLEADWTARVRIDGVETGPFRKLSGILARRAAIPLDDLSDDPLQFDNAVEFGADFAPRSVLRVASEVGDLVALGPPRDQSETAAQGSLFRNLTRSQVRAALRSTTLGTSTAPDLEWFEANLELVEAAFALPDAHYSRLIFEPTSFRVIFAKADQDPAEVTKTETGQYQGSFLSLGPLGPGELRGYFGLSRAKLHAARAHDMACMNFRFRGVGLAVADSNHEIVLEKSVCGVEVAAKLSDDASGPKGPPRDDRPLLVVEFPPQHVLEEACFVPAPPPLPDLKLGAKGKRAFVTRRKGRLSREVLANNTETSFADDIWVVDPFDNSDIAVALSRLTELDDRIQFRCLVNKIKIDEGVGDVEAFEAVSKALNGFTPASRNAANVRRLPKDQRVYIGPVANDPDAAIALRRIQRAEQAKLIGHLVEAMFIEVRDQASRMIAAGLPEILNFETDFSAALALEGRLEATVPTYQLFRAFYRDETLALLHDSDSAYGLLPPDPAYFEFAIDKIPDTSDGSTAGTVFDARIWKNGLQSPHPLSGSHPKRVIENFQRFLSQDRKPTGLAHARNAAPSRLAFHIECRDRLAAARLQVNRQRRLVDALEELPEASLGLGRSRMDFTLRALTDWSSMELSVVKRAANVYSPASGGRLDARSGRTIDLSEAARLRLLGYSPAEEDQSINSETRLADIERSMSDPPDLFETAIEIPARLQLSPSDSAVFLNRRGVIRAIFRDGKTKVTDLTEADFAAAPGISRLWTARLHTGGLDPGLRAIHSQDFRADFVWGGARIRQSKRLGDTVRLPGGSAPPGGNLAPWMIGPTEGLGTTPDARRLTQFISEMNPSDAKEWSSGGGNFEKLEELLKQTEDLDERAFCRKVLRQQAVKPYVVPRLIDLLCQRSPFLRRWSAKHEQEGNFSRDATNAIFEHLRHFRAPLSANDRHQLVVLTSAYGLPVTGRLNEAREVIPNSGQVEVEDGFALSDLLPGSAIYRPATLEVSELSLSALGGSLRLDTSFEPPVAARQLDGIELFDALTVEKWQQWTVLGRDVYTEIVYKGFLYPFGHRASLVKVTERTFFRDPADGVQRAYLRQRMFIRCSKPTKLYPAVGQANGGRGMPADRITVLTVQSPDIVDPYFGQAQAGDSEEAQLLPSGRITLGKNPGLAFLPRTALIDGAEVRFELDVAGHFSDLPLVFVDNTAANNRDALALLEDFYHNKIPSPDTYPMGASGNVVATEINPQIHMRSLRFDGGKIRYAPEITSGSASIETDVWTLAVEGREDRTGPTAVDRPPAGKYGDRVRTFAFNNSSYAFTSLLQGVDQPPFYPTIDTARIRLRQNERLTGKVGAAVRVRFDGHYLANGLPLAIPAAEGAQEGVLTDIEQASRAIGNGSQIVLVCIDPVKQDMGKKGDNSGGVFRPSGFIVAFSRSKGVMTFGDMSRVKLDVLRDTDPGQMPGAPKGTYVVQPSLADALEALPPPPKALPLAGAPAAANAQPAAAPSEGDIEKTLRKLRSFYSDIFDDGAKILGLVSIKDLLGLLTELSGNGKDGGPELLEQIQYGAGQVAGAADDAAEFVRESVLKPLDRALMVIRDSWTEIDERLREFQNISGKVVEPVTLQELFPELFAGLRSLQAAVQKALGIEDSIAFALSLSEVYEAGQRFLNAVQATASNPVERFENAFVSRVNVVKSLAVDFEKALPRIAEALFRPLRDATGFTTLAKATAERLATLLVPGKGGDPFLAFPILVPKPSDPTLTEIYQLAIPTNAFVRQQVEDLALIVFDRLKKGQSLDLKEVLASDEGMDLIANLQDEMGRRLKQVLDKLENLGTPAAMAYAGAVAGLQAMAAKGDPARFRRIVEAHLRREFDPIMRFAVAVGKLVDAFEPPPADFRAALEHAIEAVEVLTGDLGIEASDICNSNSLGTALSGVAKAVDPELLAFYRVEVTKLPLQACAGFEDDGLTVVAPNELRDALQGLHAKIADLQSAITGVDITQAFDKVLASPAGKLSQVKPKLEEAKRIGTSAAGKILLTSTRLDEAVTALHCALVDDAVRIRALGDVFRSALDQLKNLCADPTAALERLSKQSAAFIEGRKGLLMNLAASLEGVRSAFEVMIGDEDVQAVAKVGGIAALLAAVIELVPDAQKQAFKAAVEDAFGDVKARVDSELANFSISALEAYLELTEKLRILVAKLADGAKNLQSQYDEIPDVLRALVVIDTKVFEVANDNADRLRTFLQSLEEALKDDIETARSDPTKALGRLREHVILPAAPTLSEPKFSVYVRDAPDIFSKAETAIASVLDSYSASLDKAVGQLTAELLQGLDRLVADTLGNADPGGLWKRLRPQDNPLKDDTDFMSAKFGVVWALYRLLEKLREELFKSHPNAAQIFGSILLVDRRDGTPANPTDLLDRLSDDVAGLRAAFSPGGPNSTPVSVAANRKFLSTFVREWAAGNSTPHLILGGVRKVFADLIRGNIIQQFPFDQIRDQIENELRSLVPTRVQMNFAFGTKLNPGMKSATAGIFEPMKGSSFKIKSVIAIDIGSGKPEVSFRSEGEIGKFNINLVGSFKAITLKFNGARFISENGANPTFLVDYADYTIGKELQFVQQLQSYFTPKDGSGFYLEPLASPIGIEAGYDLPLGTISIGTASFFNVAISAAARLPFGDDEARFRGSLSRRAAPFTVSIAPYGGSGFFAIEANTKGIVGFEASFEFGGAGAFAFGPLTGQGRLMAGIYVRQTQVKDRGKVTEISGTFFVGGSANIWIFSFGASLYVRLGMVGGDMSGEAVFTFSFSMGIMDFEYSVEVWRKEGEGFQSSSHAALPLRGTRLARHFYASAALADLVPGEIAITSRVPQVQIDVARKATDWRAYRTYFDRSIRVEDPF